MVHFFCVQPLLEKLATTCYTLGPKYDMVPFRIPKYFDHLLRVVLCVVPLLPVIVSHIFKQLKTQYNKI